ncbi:MAG: hypothetical protein STSR0009_03100 [Methanoregula sp.]
MRGRDVMKSKKELYPVSDTAALVMLWASEYYRTKPLTRAYVNGLDLSSGEELLRCYDRICPWYPEVIINRKHFISQTVQALTVKDDAPVTLVNLGAGFSPLALEMVPLLSDTRRFIEIDLAGMRRKHELYEELVPEQSGWISCIEADITEPGALMDALLPEQDRAGLPRLIVVMEGLTYYIRRSGMEQILDTLSSLSPSQSIVFEHLKPCRLISDERRFIPYEIFSHVRDHIAYDRMTTYSRDEIPAMLSPAFTCRYYDMSDMERQRIGGTRYFPTTDSGWLSCAVAERGALSKPL